LFLRNDCSQYEGGAVCPSTITITYLCHSAFAHYHRCCVTMFACSRLAACEQCTAPCQPSLRSHVRRIHVAEGDSTGNSPLLDHTLAANVFHGSVHIFTRFTVVHSTIMIIQSIINKYKLLHSTLQRPVYHWTVAWCCHAVGILSYGPKAHMRGVSARSVAMSCHAMPVLCMTLRRSCSHMQQSLCACILRSERVRVDSDALEFDVDVGSMLLPTDRYLFQ
jgi:hypothetical protein